MGCQQFLDNIRSRQPNTNNNNNKAGVIPEVTSRQLVGYLNAQAERLQTINYDEAVVTAKEGDDFRDRLKSMTYPTLHGRLAASQPQKFRMVVEGGAVTAKVDMGSNPQVFWVAAKIPTQQPIFYFASHTDFESGKAKLPGGIPFEPEWVMQALGMTTFSPTVEYKVRIDEKSRTYVLSWPATTPGGMQIRKEVVFLADDADGSRNEPQVRKHLISDIKGRVICSAEVKAARTIPVGGTDPVTKRPYVVQYPTHVVLRYEDQKFEMTLKLDKATVNQTMGTEETHRLFDLPTNTGANPVNLAEARFAN
jgi:hypothetical protein